MQTLEAIYARQMIRRYTDRPVSDEIIRRLLEAGARAPSPHNRQPWRFAVIRNTWRARLADAMGKRLRADLTHDGVAPTQIEQDVARSYQRLTSAPVLILVCLSMADMDVYPDGRRNQAERWMAGQAVAAAIQNMLLAATELGLGACWMCAPLFCPDTVIETLGLPTDWEPQGLITLGYPDPEAPAKRRARKAIDTITLWRR
ncbi:MAG: nitroreductase family protein [Anaerolineae bacterium]|nr:nitroreductase family protein [Thermoflexales bacterium]MDW8406578.1 nitroreductase family protein [Anaerolineae bacterium]